MGLSLSKVLDPGDLFAGRGAKKAAEAHADAANYAADLSAKTQREMFDKGQEATRPWRESGARGGENLRHHRALHLDARPGDPRTVLGIRHRPRPNPAPPSLPPSSAEAAV